MSIIEEFFKGNAMLDVDNYDFAVYFSYDGSDDNYYLRIKKSFKWQKFEFSLGNLERVGTTNNPDFPNPIDCMAYIGTRLD